MTLERFIRLADSLVEFKSSLNDEQVPMSSIHSIETHNDELKSKNAFQISKVK